MLMMPALSYLGTSDQAAAYQPPDANTTFLCRFNTTTPVDEVSLATGTLVGNASCDTGNMELVLDGAGDWCTFPGSSVFDLSFNMTIEIWTNMASTQVGGLISRSSSGNSRYALYCSGSSGNIAFYADAYLGGASPLFSSNSLDSNWHHIEVVRNGISAPNWAMYVDGGQVGTNSWTSGPSPASSDTFYIGTDVADTTNRDMAGRIARVKISNNSRHIAGGFTPPSRTSV